MNKQFFISLFFALATLIILGAVFANFVFLPEFEIWHDAYPEAVREAPDFISGLVLALLQLIGFIILLPKLQITSGSGAAMFGAVYSVIIWLIVDLQMVSITHIVSYEYVLKDALLSGVMGAILGLVVSWSQRRFV